SSSCPARRLHQLSHSGPLDQCIYLRRGRVQRFPWLSLTHQRAMQLDLQNLRQLGVDRRHWSRCRALDGASCVVQRNGNRTLESSVAVEGGASWILANGLRSLEHLLGSGEISDQLVRGIRKFGVG